MSDKMHHTSDKDFEADVIQSDMPVLLDFRSLARGHRTPQRAAHYSRGNLSVNNKFKLISNLWNRVGIYAK